MYLTFSSSTFYPSHSTQFSFLCPLSCLSLSPGHLDERFVCNSFPRCYLRSFPFIRNLLRVRGCLTLSTKSIFCVFVSTFHIIRKFLDFCLNGNQMLDKLVVILSFSLLLLSLSLFPCGSDKYNNLSISFCSQKTTQQELHLHQI